MQDGRGGAFAKAGEKYLSQNFSKGDNAPVPLKQITVNRLTAASIDDDWQTEPIIPSTTPRPIKYKQKPRPRFTMPYNENAFFHIPHHASSSSPEPVADAAEPLLQQQIIEKDVEMPKREVSYVKQQTHIPFSNEDVPPYQDISELGPALFVMPGKDFAFKVKDEMKHIHKIVLAAQSPYFYQQFFENPGNTMNSITVTEFDKEVVELAIKACYEQPFDEATLDDYHTVEQLIKFGITFKLHCVTEVLRQKLHITEENVCSLAIFAFKFNDRDLCQQCANFLAAAIISDEPTPPGIENLPAEMDKEIVRALIKKNKK